MILLKILSSAIRKRNNSAKYTPGHTLVLSVGNWEYLWGYLHSGGDEGPLSDWEPLDKLCSGLSCIEQLISKCCHVVFHSLGPHPTPVQSSLPWSWSIQHNEFKTQIRKILHWKLTLVKPGQAWIASPAGQNWVSSKLSGHTCVHWFPLMTSAWGFISPPNSAGHAADLFLKAGLGTN